MSWFSNLFGGCQAEQTYIANLKSEIADRIAYEKNLEAEIEQLKVALDQPLPLPEVTYEQPQHFPNYHTLLNWLYEDRTDRETYVENTFDCEDFAMRLQKEALEDGWIISIQLDNVAHHALNNAFLPSENKIYFIEPQNDGLWLVGAMD